MLAKELLKDDGVIFISIDDNEQANLKIICDEIFGEENFISNNIWIKKNSPQNDAKKISPSHDYIVCYAKNIINYNMKLLPRDEKSLSKFKNPDNDIRGLWSKGDLTSKTKAAGHSYPIVSPSGKEFLPTSGRQWGAAFDTYQKWLKEGRIWFGTKGDSAPIKKQFLSEIQQGIVPMTLWESEQAGDNTSASKVLKNLDIPFESSKPVKLIKHAMKITIDPNDTILDFFAGSGTTAHAVMQLNAEDGGNRKFILCQLDEEINPAKSKPAYDFCTDNNFEPVISSITIERVNRAGEKIKDESPMFTGDIGYKVFSHTQKPRVDYDEAQKSFNIINQRVKTIDTLINMLVATCKPLDTKIQTIKQDTIYKADNEIYVVNKITASDLEPFKDLKINIDALADFNLTDYLNIDLSYQDNITMIY